MPAQAAASRGSSPSWTALFWLVASELRNKAREGGCPMTITALEAEVNAPSLQRPLLEEDEEIIAQLQPGSCSMSITSVDAPTLRRPLLEEGEDEDEEDEDIIAQLQSSHERSYRPQRCHKCVRARGLWIPLVALIALLGLVGAVWATCSCDLVAVEWNPGGLQLSITAVGIWSYQREIAEPPRKGKDSNNNPTTELICVGYGTTPEMQRASQNTEDFFPSSKTRQIYSILGPSLYFAAILTMTVFAMATSFSSVALARDRDAATSAAAAAVAAVLLLSSGIFQLLSVHGLMHHSDKICNKSYSRCSLSRVGGHWAIVGIFCAFFVCGLASCFAANVGYRMPEMKTKREMMRTLHETYINLS